MSHEWFLKHATTKKKNTHANHPPEFLEHIPNTVILPLDSPATAVRMMSGITGGKRRLHHRRGYFPHYLVQGRARRGSDTSFFLRSFFNEVSCRIQCNAPQSRLGVVARKVFPHYDACLFALHRVPWYLGQVFRYLNRRVLSVLSARRYCNVTFNIPYTLLNSFLYSPVALNNLSYVVGCTLDTSPRETAAESRRNTKKEP